MPGTTPEEIQEIVHRRQEIEQRAYWARFGLPNMLRGVPYGFQQADIFHEEVPPMPSVQINEIERPRFSLGWELEACIAASKTPLYVVKGEDGSVSGDGVEYRLSNEIVQKPELGILALRQLTKDKTLGVDQTCGFHVHVGYPTMQNNRNMERGKLWAAWNVNLAREIEEQAFKCVPFSRTQNDFCASWKSASLTTGLMKQGYSRNKYDNARRRWVNHVEMFRPGGIGTVENRLMGETKRFTQLYSWIAFCFVMAQAAYRLVEDPSLMPVEVGRLKDVLRMIEDGIKEKKAGNVAVARDLGQIAGLVFPATAEPKTKDAPVNPDFVHADCGCQFCLESRAEQTPTVRITHIAPTVRISDRDADEVAF